jgi:hypothetical protein
MKKRNPNQNRLLSLNFHQWMVILFFVGSGALCAYSGSTVPNQIHLNQAAIEQSENVPLIDQLHTHKFGALAEAGAPAGGR